METLSKKVEQSEYPKCKRCSRKCTSTVIRKLASKMIEQTIVRPVKHQHYGTARILYYKCSKPHLNYGKQLDIIWKECGICEAYKKEMSSLTSSLSISPINSPSSSGRSTPTRIPILKKHKRAESETYRSEYHYNSYVPPSKMPYANRTAILIYPTLDDTSEKELKHKRSLTPDYSSFTSSLIPKRKARTPKHQTKKRVQFIQKEDWDKKDKEKEKKRREEIWMFPN